MSKGNFEKKILEKLEFITCKHVDFIIMILNVLHVQLMQLYPNE